MSSLTTFFKLATDKAITEYQSKHPKMTIQQIEELNQKKMELINKQIKNYGMYIHYGLNDKFQNSFQLSNIITYNDKIIDSYNSFKKIFTLNNMLKYNYTEHLYLNQSRIFYDIDYSEDTPENREELNKVIKSILFIADTFGLKMYGIFEIKDEEYEDMVLDCPGILTYCNENQTKLISGHIYFNGYADRKDIEIFMSKYIFNKFKFTNNHIFDTSVYKSESKQSLRCGWSAKVIDDKTIRKIPDDILEDMIKHYDILYNLRLSPLRDDILIDLKEYINECKSYNQSCNKLNQSYTHLSNLSNNSSDKHISIFQYIKHEDKIINVKDIYQDLNHYDFGKNLLLQFCQCVLSPEEIKEEIMNIDFPDELHNGKTSNQWLEEIYKSLKPKIKQDITNISKLYVLKKYMKEYYENIIKDIKDSKKLKQIYKAFEPYFSSIDYYIRKYEKLNFVSRDYYDYYESKESKKTILLYNCYRNIDGQIYNAFDNSVYNNITQFRLKYKLSGDMANKIYEQLATFNNEQEYKIRRIEYNVSQIPDSELKIYKSNLLKFLKIFKNSFKHEDDYNYYLSYYSEKLNTLTTIKKGLINQGTERDPAINSFKTLFNELLDNYLVVITGEVNNINKTLNGSYFTGNLLVIEELPKKIKEIDNFINILRTYTERDTLTIEKKGKNSEQIINNFDFIINTNHTVKDMFKDFNDAEGLLKRFRIITRQSVKMTNEVNEIIDEIKKNKNIYQCLLKEYLIKEITNKYFIEHKNEYNEIMKLYINSSSTKSTMNKKSTNISLIDFIEDFKTNYIDSKNRLKLNKFRDNLIKDGVISLESSKTLKQNLIILLSEDKTIDSSKEELITVSKDGRITIIKDEAINIIYDTYYEYDGYIDDDDDDKSNDTNKNTTNTDKNTTNNGESK